MKLKRLIMGLLAAGLLFAGVLAQKGVCRAEQTASIIGAYTVNNQIYINELGKPEGKPLTSGHLDYKPVWSQSGSMLVFFRVEQLQESLVEWKTAICIIRTDGAGFRKLTGGSHTDFNPTWTRDGSNRIVFTRISDSGRRCEIYMTSPNGKAGDERLISDPDQIEVVHSCLKDGRIFLTSSRDGGGAFLLTPGSEGQGRYERIRFTFDPGGWVERLSFSPSERRVVYESNPAMTWNYYGHPLVMADFDPVSLTISNPVVIKESHNDSYNLYPRWTRDECAIIYQSSPDGRRNRLLMYRLDTKTTTKISTNDSADYGFFCGEATPW